MNHMPIRTCIATNERFPQSELLRIVRVKQGENFEVKVSTKANRKMGRSAYIKPDKDLIDEAIKKKSFERKLKLGRGLREEEIQKLLAFS